MIRDVATALYLEKPDSQRGKGRFRNAEMSLPSGSSEGDNRRMLDQEQYISNAILSSERCHPPLHSERFAVGHEPEVD
jgi:hypothetical protein